jgi:hypothetical protein
MLDEAGLVPLIRLPSSGAGLDEGEVAAVWSTEPQVS